MSSSTDEIKDSPKNRGTETDSDFVATISDEGVLIFDLEEINPDAWIRADDYVDLGEWR